MLKIGREHGFYTESYEDRVGSIGLEKKNLKNTIGFWSHLDIVPVGSNWQYDPFDATYIEPFLIGRGVSDNKSPAVAMVYLMECFRELNIPLKHELCLYVGCDEEKGMSDLEYFVSKYETPAFSMVPDTGFPVCYGEKGILEGEMITKGVLSGHFVDFSGGIASNMIPDRAFAVLTGDESFLDTLEEQLNALKKADAEKEKEEIPTYFDFVKEGTEVKITYYGISKHSAAPQGSKNAIHGLCKVLQSLDVLKKEDKETMKGIEKLSGEYMGEVPGIAYEDEISGSTTCTATIISLKEGKLYLNLNIRYAITADNEKDMNALAAFAEENGMVFRLERNSKPNYFPKENPMVDLLTKVFNDATGETSESYVMGGGTYARKLPNAIAYGLGGIKETQEERELRKELILPGHGGAHEPDEILNVRTYLEGIKVYARAMIALNEVEF